MAVYAMPIACSRGIALCSTKLCYYTSMLTFFAHAGEQHETTAETTVHFLQDWYIALPLLILCIIGFATLVFFLSRRSKAATYLAVIGLLLVAGVFAYTQSPIISVVSLTAGMAMTLLLVLMSLLPKKG